MDRIAENVTLHPATTALRRSRARPRQPDNCTLAGMIE
jgi:hypothetical protein